jgi:hypothetical protein
VPYAAPTRALLRQSISRDVQDPNNRTFTSDEINDLINEAIVELNRLRPKEYVGDIALTDGVYSYSLADDLVRAVFKVEVWRDGAFYHSPAEIEGDATTGWDFFAGSLYIPAWSFLNADTDVIRVWGYSDREGLILDIDVLDAHMEGEQIIRAYAKNTIFQRLATDRALFGQWQTQSNNSDVSATQLLGMSQVFGQRWRELERKARMLRRVG